MDRDVRQRENGNFHGNFMGYLAKRRVNGGSTVAFPQRELYRLCTIPKYLKINLTIQDGNTVNEV